MYFELALSHLVLAAIAMVFVLGNKNNTNSQKGLQLLLAFIVPFMGPAIVIVMWFYMRAKPSSQKSAVGDSAEEHVNKYYFDH